MAKQVQWRKGTTAQHKSFVGANCEITVDTTKKTLVVHDGITPGGSVQATEKYVNDAYDKRIDIIANKIKVRAKR